MSMTPQQTDVSKKLAWGHCTTPPDVVTLCGSTRFMDQFFKSGWEETLKGNIVLSVGVVVRDEKLSSQLPNDHLGEHFGVKDLLDEIHFRKIDLSDAILVLNVDGYIGKSTQREMAYAIATHCDIRFLEPEAGERVMGERSHEIGAQVAAFVTGEIAPLCTACGDKGVVIDLTAAPEPVEGPCPKCDPTQGARQQA